jgi:hypothetical protein
MTSFDLVAYKNWRHCSREWQNNHLIYLVKRFSKIWKTYRVDVALSEENSLNGLVFLYKDDKCMTTDLHVKWFETNVINRIYTLYVIVSNHTTMVLL